MHGHRQPMNIRFISSMTAEDENSLAPALLRALGSLLDQLPIAYTVRIETTDAQVFQHVHPAIAEPRSGGEGGNGSLPIKH